MNPSTSKAPPSPSSSATSRLPSSPSSSATSRVPSSAFSSATSKAPPSPSSSATSSKLPHPLSAQYPRQEHDSRALSLVKLNANLEENSQVISDKIFLCLFDKDDGLVETINKLISNHEFDRDSMEHLLKKISSKLHSDFKKISLQEIFAEDIDDGEKILSKKKYEDFFNKITHGQKIKSKIETLNERDLVKEKKLSYETGQDALILLMKLNRAVKNLSKYLRNINIINEATNKECLQTSLSEFLDGNNQELFSKLGNFYTDTIDKITSLQLADEKSASSDFSLRYSSSKLAKKAPASFNFGHCRGQIKELLGDVNRAGSLLLKELDYEKQKRILGPYTEILLTPTKSSENFPLNKKTRKASSSFLSSGFCPFTGNPAHISKNEKINLRALRYLFLGMENINKILRENLDSIDPQASNGALKYESPPNINFAQR
ncbi:MAG: hypothetical protein EBS92_06155 [Proteobacteria bacterium]|nr:hypothetical protein [Pseudomonadota bacterium]